MSTKASTSRHADSKFRAAEWEIQQSPCMLRKLKQKHCAEQAQTHRRWEGCAGAAVGSKTEAMVESRTGAMVESKTGAAVGSRMEAMVESRTGVVVESRTEAMVESRTEAAALCSRQPCIHVIISLPSGSMHACRVKALICIGEDVQEQSKEQDLTKSTAGSHRRWVGCKVEGAVGCKKAALTAPAGPPPYNPPPPPQQQAFTFRP